MPPTPLCSFFGRSRPKITKSSDNFGRGSANSAPASNRDTESQASADPAALAAKDSLRLIPTILTISGIQDDRLAVLPAAGRRPSSAREPIAA